MLGSICGLTVYRAYYMTTIVSVYIFGLRWNFSVLGNFLSGAHRLFDWFTNICFLNSFIVLLTIVMSVVVESCWSFP